MSNFKITVLRGRNLAARDKSGKSDPYIVLKVDGKQEKTKKQKQTLDPVWNEEFIIKNISDASLITCQCYDWDAVGRDDSMGEFIIPTEDIKAAKSAPIEKWYMLYQKKGEKDPVKGDILLRFEFPGLTPPQAAVVQTPQPSQVPHAGSNQNFNSGQSPYGAPGQYPPQHGQTPYPQPPTSYQQAPPQSNGTVAQPGVGPQGQNYYPQGQYAPPPQGQGQVQYAPQHGVPTQAQYAPQQPGQQGAPQGQYAPQPGQQAPPQGQYAPQQPGQYPPPHGQVQGQPMYAPQPGTQPGAQPVYGHQPQGSQGGKPLPPPPQRQQPGQAPQPYPPQGQAPQPGQQVYAPQGQYPPQQPGQPVQGQGQVQYAPQQPGQPVQGQGQVPQPYPPQGQYAPQPGQPGQVQYAPQQPGQQVPPQGQYAPQPGAPKGQVQYAPQQPGQQAPPQGQYAPQQPGQYPPPHGQVQGQPMYAPPPQQGGIPPQNSQPQMVYSPPPQGQPYGAPQGQPMPQVAVGYASPQPGAVKNPLPPGSPAPVVYAAPQGYAPQPGSPYPPQHYAPPPQGQVVYQQPPPQQIIQQTTVVTGPAVTVYNKPMKFKIKQRFFSGDMKIYNEAGEEILYAHQKAFSWGHDLKVYAPGGEQLGEVKQKIRFGMPHFKLSIRGQKMAVMKQKFTFFSPKFKIEMVDPKFGEDLVAKGDVSNYDFTIKRGDRLVATVSKKFFSARDVYGVEVVPGEDVVLILQAVIVLDKCLHEDNDNKSGFQVNF